MTRGIIIIVKKRNRSYDALIPSDIKEAISTFLTDELIEESIRFKEFSNNGNRWVYKRKSTRDSRWKECNSYNKVFRNTWKRNGV